MAIKSLSARATALIAVSCLSVSVATAQTPIKLPKNKYTPEQDVQIGREAAAEVRQQYPIIQDEQVTKYLATLGDRLVAAAPAELKKPVYEYSFTPVNLKEINAFALPGGPVFVHRGMFRAAATEAEVVGVMAHELSHVLLLHGTANASKAQNPWLQLGQLAGQIGGAMVGGGTGAAIAQGADFGLGTLLMKYSRDFEKQADLLGAQIMAKAGYDPRALGRMFETIEKESRSSGGGGPQWMSSHPNPGNRTIDINKEAEALTIASAADDSQFTPIKTAFSGMPAALTMAELARRKTEGAGNSVQLVGTPGQPVPRPSAEFRAINGGKPRHRIRHRAGGNARSAGSNHHVAESGRAEQSRAQARRRPTAAENLAADGHWNAARQPVAARRPGADRALYDLPGGRDALLLFDRRARKGRREFPGDLQAHRRVDPPHRRTLTKVATTEQRRLEEARDRNIPWRKWGPYLSERQWGTVREDYFHGDNGAGIGASHQTGWTGIVT